MPDMQWQDIKGWLTCEEGDCLRQHAAGRRVLEFGCYLGRSTVAMAEVAESVDTVDHGLYSSMDKAIENFQLHGVDDKIRLHIGTTQQVAPSLKGPFGMGFIDAGHKFDDIAGDLQLCEALLARDAVWVVHDYKHGKYPCIKEVCNRFFEGPSWERLDDGSLNLAAWRRVQPAVSVIIPTIGRASLRQALESVVGQLSDNDEVIVVVDGMADLPRQIAKEFGPQVRVDWIKEANDYGGSPRNKGMELATKPHLMFIDDDDMLLPGAVDRIKQVIAEKPQAMLLFRMRRGFPYEDLIWEVRNVERWNVSTQNIVVPNQPDRLALWGKKRCSDYEFVKGMVAKGWRVEWIDEITVEQNAFRSAQVERAPEVRGVTAMMITGKHPDRRKLALRAVESFLRQTYTNSRMVIINDSDTPLGVDHDRIREVMVPKQQTLGDLRNLAVAFAEDDWVVFWDDDDWCHPDRIAVQAEVARRTGAAVGLQSWCISDMEGKGGVHSGPARPYGVLPGTLLFPKTRARFPVKARREDDDYLHQVAQRVGVVPVANEPSLYIHFYHGRNVWHKEHHMGQVQRGFTEDEAAYVRGVLLDCKC